LEEEATSDLKDLLVWVPSEKTRKYNSPRGSQKWFEKGRGNLKVGGKKGEERKEKSRHG